MTCAVSRKLFNLINFICPDNVQIVRALLMGGVAIGILGFILSLVGMECTYIGGKEKEKNRAIFIGSLCHTTSGTEIHFLNYYYMFDLDSKSLKSEINHFVSLQSLILKVCYLQQGMLSMLATLQQNSSILVLN